MKLLKRNQNWNNKKQTTYVHLIQNALMIMSKLENMGEREEKKQQSVCRLKSMKKVGGHVEQISLIFRYYLYLFFSG